MSKIYGTSGNDTMSGQGNDSLYGGAGNDYIEFLGGKGGLYGGNGNDTLVGSKTGTAQIHMYGGDGNDTIRIDVTNGFSSLIADGHHVFGGRGSDKFMIVNSSANSGGLVGRIDDFDSSRDTIWLDGVQLDLANLPGGSRIVEVDGQQWLVVSNKSVYALEGARKSTNFRNHEEDHYPNEKFQKEITDNVYVNDIASKASTTYEDRNNYVPYNYYQAVESSLNKTVTVNTEYTGSSSAPVDAEMTYVTVLGTVANDLIFDGGGVEDTIFGGAGSDVIDANGGNDVVYGGDGNDLIAGGLDRDVLYGETGNDTVFGGTENDTIYGGIGFDSIYGGSGSDALYGGDASDRIYGMSGADSLVGGAGNDSLYGGIGDDTIRGEDNGDLIYGDDGNDLVYGDGGEDTVNGGPGNDSIYGGASDDFIYGGAGNDFIRGGSGKDIASGGSGTDRFAFSDGDMINWANLSGTTEEMSLKLDRVMDFVVGQDKIDFSNFTGVNSRSDFSMWQTIIDGNAYFTLRVLATNERILIDVTDDITYSSMYIDSNFIF